MYYVYLIAPFIYDLALIYYRAIDKSDRARMSNSVFLVVCNGSRLIVMLFMN